MARTASDIVIDADAARIMDVIADFDSYPSWATGVRSAEVVVEGNGTYVVSDLVKYGGNINVNGVSLLVFYDDGDPSNNSTVAIFDGNDSNVDNPYDRPGWNASLTNLPYAGGRATLGLHVSDGQTFPDAALWANDTLLAAAGAVFDGNTVPGWPGPTGNGSLWDIREFDVTDLLADGATSIEVTTGLLSDCLSLVVATLDPGLAPHLGQLAGLVAELVLWRARRRRSFDQWLLRSRAATRSFRNAVMGGRGA